MRKFKVITLFSISAVLLFSGCSLKLLASPSAIAPSLENLPEVSASPTLSSDLTSSNPNVTSSYEEMTFGGYVYYFDLNSNTEGRYSLSRKNIETDAIENLYFTASDIYSFGDNQYADVIVSDDSLYPDWDTHWLACKVDKNGNILKFIGGDSVLIQHDDSLYYTIYGESCIFKSDLDCSDPVRIPIVPSEDEDPFETLSLTVKGRLTAMIDLYSIEDGWINIGYDIINEQIQCLFYTSYNISLSDYHVEEAHPGRYYDNRVYKDPWLYYLDMENPIESPDSEEPLFYIHRMKEDGSRDENLNVLCFSFDFAGEYLYTDTNITFGDFGHWESYRYDLNGKGEKQIKYGNMTRFSKDNYLYFATFDESAFYRATTACTKVKKYEVKIPDDREIHEKLDYNYECVFITVTDEKTGWVYFEFEVTDTGPYTYYIGSYRMNLESRKIEKVGDGEYFLDEEEWE